MTKRVVMTCLSDEEVNIVDRASELERRSRSQFIAKTSVDKAKEILNEGVVNES